MKTVKVNGGKEYVMVHERIKYFKENYPEGRIITELVSFEDGLFIMKAYIYDGEKLLSTGHAYEHEGSSNVNKTSALENCETSCVGRALGFNNIGIDTSVATAEEVQTAILQQNELNEKIEYYQAALSKCETVEDLEKTYLSIPKHIRQYLNKFTTELKNEFAS